MGESCNVDPWRPHWITTPEEVVPAPAPQGLEAETYVPYIMVLV